MKDRDVFTSRADEDLILPHYRADYLLVDLSCIYSLRLPNKQI